MSVTVQRELLNTLSPYDVNTTTDRLVAVLEEKGLNVFLRLDHAAGAAKIGQALRPTQLVIFGKPEIGTPLMQDQQTAGLDLPQKILVREDEEGKVWLTYDNPEYLAASHGLDGSVPVLGNIKAALGNFVAAVVNDQI